MQSPASSGVQNWIKKCLHQPSLLALFGFGLPKRVWWPWGVVTPTLPVRLSPQQVNAGVTPHQSHAEGVCPDLISLLLSQSLILNWRTHIPSGYLRTPTEIDPLLQPWRKKAALKPHFPHCWGTARGWKGRNFPAGTPVVPKDENARVLPPQG